MTIVTNIPTPYRMPVYEHVDAAPDVDLSVLYMAERESNRRWTLPSTSVRSVTLRSRSLSVGGRYIHFTPGAWRALGRLQPQVVVTTGFNPPQLVAFAWAVLHGVPHVAQTDGTVESEATLTAAHRLVRQVVGRRSAVLVATSRSGLRLARSWGRPGTPSLTSPLAVDNDVFAQAADGVEKDVDLLFSGRLSPVKDPLFALDAAAAAATRLRRRLTVAIIGDGPLRDDVRARAEALADRLEVLLPGFQQQDALPGWYGRSRLFLFPTHWDPWGLVLNEALAAGVPAIASPAAGSAAELLGDGRAGTLLPHDPDAWADGIVRLLGDDRARAEAAAAAREAVSGYTLEAAADGLIGAARTAAGAASLPHGTPARQDPARPGFVDSPVVRVAGVLIAATSLDRAVGAFVDLAAERGGEAVAVRLTNAYSLALAAKDPAYREVLLGPGVNLPDGAPVARVVKQKSLHHLREGNRVRGPSFFTRVLDEGRRRDVRHFLLGASPESLDALVDEAHRRYPGVAIAGSWSPAFGPVDERFLADAEARVRAAGADVLWLGLGTPKQDFASARLSERLGIPVVGVGAAFDFLSGATREAPPLLRDHGLEWLFRLATEPRRLWRRYLFGNVGFLRALVADESAARRSRLALSR